MTPAERLSGRMPTEADIDAIARATLARLPSPFAESLGDIVLAIEPVADVETARGLGLRHPMQLSGLYEGISLNHRSVSHSGTLPERITLYSRPILAEWQSTRVSLEQLVSHIVIHEIGHHFGFSDDDMHARGRRRVTGLLRFDGVALRRGGRLLFEDLEFALAPGEALQVIGPNGSGKSSLIRLAAGLLRQERGEIERSALTLADDQPALDRELPLGRALSFWGRSPGAAMEKLGIAHLAEIPVRLLSSGQLKRATLARAAASSAHLWLLDEPLNALDADGAERLSKLVADHRVAGGAVLVASHQPLVGDWTRLEIGE